MRLEGGERGRQVLSETFRLTKRAAKIAGGFVLLLAGLVMLVTPGPGWAAIALGLALLATEFRWARLLLDRVKERAVRLRDAVRRPPR
jgi:uncharacterized protein (TIGR02611 family)